MRMFRLVAALMAAVLVSSLAAAPLVAAPAPSSRPLVVVLAPYLRWSDVTPEATPNLWRMAQNGAIGNMSTQTRDQDWPPVVRGALTFSAGAWAGSPDGALSAYDASEVATDNSTAASLYPGLFGHAVPAGATVLYLGLPAAQADNAPSLTPVNVGLLGQTLRDAGRPTAAFGNSDTDTSTANGVMRPAAIVAADTGGATTGDVGPKMLVPDPTAPFGKRTDYEALASAAETSLASMQSAGGAGLVVVDTGDLIRARDSAATRPSDIAALDRDGAIAGLDTTIETIRASRFGRDVNFLVVVPAVEQQAWNQPELAPILLAGPDIQPGWLTSASTHRSGLVSNLDVAPTVLGRLGVQAPDAMLGSPAVVTAAAPTSSPADRIAHLSAVNAFALATDAVRDPFVKVWIAFSILALVGGLVAVWRASAGVWSRVARGLLLGALSLPPATYLAVFPTRYPASASRVGWAVVIWAVLLWLAALIVGRFWRRVQSPVFCLAALTGGFVCLDQLLHRPWAESGIFSYSVLAGWRYYGVGNEASGFAIAGVLLALGLLFDLQRRETTQRITSRFVVPVVGLVAIGALAAPMFGANAGVAVWGLVGLAVFWVALSRVRVSWKVVAIGVGALVAVVALLAVLDLSRGAGQQTHLGRMVAELLRGDTTLVWQLVVRKAFNAFTYSRDTIYTWLAVGAAAALVVLRFGLAKAYRDWADSNRGAAAALLGVVVASVVALVTEDSGSAMPAVMLTPAAATVLYLMIREIVARRAAKTAPAAADAGGDTPAQPEHAAEHADTPATPADSATIDPEIQGGSA